MNTTISSPTAMKIYLEGIPIELSRINLEVYNELQRHAFILLNHYKSPAEIEYLLGVDPKLWTNPEDYLDIITVFFENRSGKEMTYAERMLYNSTCFLALNPSQRELQKQHQTIYEKEVQVKI